MKKKPPEPNSINYYIEKVIDYRTEYETSDSVEYSYPPVVAELLLSILISVRAIRLSLPLAISLLIARAFFWFLMVATFGGKANRTSLTVGHDQWFKVQTALINGFVSTAEKGVGGVERRGAGFETIQKALANIVHDSTTFHDGKDKGL